MENKYNIIEGMVYKFCPIHPEIENPVTSSYCSQCIIDVQLKLAKKKTSFKMLEPQSKFVKKESNVNEFNTSIADSLNLISELANSYDLPLLVKEYNNLKQVYDKLSKMI